MTTNGTCIAYAIVDRICLMVDFIYSEDGRTSAMILDSGCFADGSPVHYNLAKSS